MSKIYPQFVKKHEKWRPGVVLGALGRALGGIWAPRRPKAQKRVDFDPHPAPPEGAFLAPFPLWVPLGTLKWWSLGGIHFDITLLIKF